MNYKKTTLLLLLISSFSYAQLKYGTPPENSLPEKLTTLPKKITVENFPKNIDPIKIKGDYYWKHNTLIFSKESAVTITEFGAYVFYNGKWNLRKSYPLRELNKKFGTKKQKLLQAQPYTWNNNWRVGNKLFDGWALWYFIGVTESGEKVVGYEKIYTSDKLIKS